MPRKLNHGVNFGDEFDAYDDDYDYEDEDDYDYEVEENDVVPDTKAKQESIKVGIWRCPICTFDNEDNMPACDICGVLRNPLVKKESNSVKNNEVDDICKEYGASIMAKSLFASMEPQKSFEAEANFNIHKLGNIHDFCRAFSSQYHYKFDIAPFEFDAPSPDDLVSSGKQTFKSKSQDFSALLPPVKEKPINVQKPSSSSASTSEGGPTKIEKSNSSSEAQSLSSKISDISLSSKSGSAKKAISRSQFKPEKWMLPEQDNNEFTQLNLAIVGHVDSGKSTLSGRLLHLLGRISQKEFHKNEKESKQLGKGSFAYAWALDESAEERERGITMAVAVAYLSSKKYHIVLLDSPGHRDFVPNMISGATQADAAILVIDASIGAFEAGINVNGGQTREHAQLIRSFGVDQIIVAVNKMDAVKYSKERFDTIKKQLGMFLRSCGFKDSSVIWIPISAMSNENLTDKSSDQLLNWFEGPCLLDAIDSLQPPDREFSKPLIMPICDVMKTTSQGHVQASGKLETGALKNGYKVLVMPCGEIATVRSLERDSEVCNIARAGDNVSVTLQGIEGNRVESGGVLCHPDFPISVTNHLELKVLILDIEVPILIGSQLECHIHTAKEAARVVKILSLLDSKTGEVAKKSLRCLLSKQNAIIEVVLQGMVCVEDYSNSRALGRVSLRASGRTVAVGIITRIIGGKD